MYFAMLCHIFLWHCFRHRLSTLTNYSSVYLQIRKVTTTRCTMSEPSIVVPDGLTLHKENTTYILLPTSNGAFLNPIQEFNRDLSVASIRVWAEGVDHEREVKWKEKIAAVPDFLANKDRKKRRKGMKGFRRSGSAKCPPSSSAQNSWDSNTRIG
jgi:hypothetical protein